MLGGAGQREARAAPLYSRLQGREKRRASDWAVQTTTMVYSIAQKQALSSSFLTHLQRAEP
eukprot:737630-Rhodomonas_salina.2